MDIVSKSAGYYESFDGTPIYYETRGEGEPLVLVYGIACLINHWHHQIEYFSKKYKVICFDIRGHHKSYPVHNMQYLRMKDLARDLSGLLQFLEVEQAHFVGHSFGAPVILELYDQQPDLFKSMTFINGFSKNPIKGMFGLEIIEPFFYFIKAQYEKQPDLWNTLWRMAIDSPLAIQFACLVGGFNIKVTQFKDIEVYARAVAHMDLNIFLNLFQELMDYDGEAVLPKIHTPTLVISGEKDNVTPQKFQHEFRDKIKNSEFLLVPYGSHCTQLDFPDYINLKMENFFQRTQKKETPT